MTIFRSITMFCGTDGIPQKIPHTHTGCGEYSIEYLVPYNIVMDLNNVMLLMSMFNQ